jgi:antitoxin component YwqK of YwqJK toxin-antitoxin module
MKQSVIIFILSMLLFSCSKLGDQTGFNREVKQDGSFRYTIQFNDSIAAILDFYPTGKIERIANFTENGQRQDIFFHESTGFVLSKLNVDENNEAEGQANYYFEKSGNLSSQYSFIQGKKVGEAVSYHDSTGRVKTYMLYNNEGQLYYRKSFDELGNHIKTEGEKDLNSK